MLLRSLILICVVLTIVQHARLIRLNASGLRIDLNRRRAPEGTARRIWTDTRDHVLFDVGPGLHRLTDNGWQRVTDAPISRLAIGRAEGADGRRDRTRTGARIDRKRNRRPT